MQLLREYLFLLLIEGKIDDLKARYPAAADMIEFLYENDPSPTKKYVPWLAKQANDPNQEWDDPRVFRAINKFHEFSKRLRRKDINAYKDLDDLYTSLSEIGDVSKSQIEKDAKVKGAVKLFENGDFLLIYIKGQAAAVNYGKGTKWCIASTEEAHHWHKYNNDDSVPYFIFQKQLPSSNPLYKIAIVFFRVFDPSDPANYMLDGYEVYDAEDTLIDIPYHLQSLFDKAEEHMKTLPPNPK